MGSKPVNSLRRASEKVNREKNESNLKEEKKKHGITENIGARVELREALEDLLKQGVDEHQAVQEVMLKHSSSVELLQNTINVEGYLQGLVSSIKSKNERNQRIRAKYRVPTVIINSADKQQSNKHTVQIDDGEPER
jgi:hypothetical protein